MCRVRYLTFFILFANSVNASQAGAGNLEIIVAVNGKNVPNYVQSEGNAKFRVNFKPQEAAVHSLSVRFNGEPVPGAKNPSSHSRITNNNTFSFFNINSFGIQDRRSAAK